MQSFLRRVVGAVGFSVGATMVSWWKFSFIVGSSMAFFSAANCVIPVAGAFCGVVGSIMVFAIRFFIRAALGTLTAPFVLQGIPSLGASLYWSVKSRLFKVAIPLMCMALFWVHPVGMQAAAYACYWFIPVIITLRGFESVFANAFASTFVAHAIGSVIWLYSTSLAPEVWLALIPVVAVERLLFASGMVVTHAIITAVSAQVSSLYRWIQSRAGTFAIK